MKPVIIHDKWIKLYKRNAVDSKLCLSFSPGFDLPFPINNHFGQFPANFYVHTDTYISVHFYVIVHERLMAM